MPNPISMRRPLGADSRPGSPSSAVEQAVRPKESTVADAMGALNLERRSHGGGDLHPHAQPPRRALLRWPNGDATLGNVTGSLASGLTFQPSSATGPLAERCTKVGRAYLPLAGHSPRGIEVVPAAGSEVSELPWVQPKLLGNLPGTDQNVLLDLADVAAGFDQEGATMEARHVLSMALSAVLSAMEGGCENRVAVQRARNALDRPSVVFEMSPAEDLDMGEPGEYMCRGRRMSGASMEDREWDFDKVLKSLGEGEHMFLRVDLESAEDAHAMAISATALGEGEVRLSVFNSNGWGQNLGNPYFDHSPAAHKTMSISRAVAALKSIDDNLICPEAGLPQPWLETWTDAAAGVPLLAWLCKAGEPESMLQLTGTRTSPQKSADCAIEVEFAWLASVLTPADYKLAKAHMLNVLAEAGSTAGWGEFELQRLRDRITTSLSGFAMSPPA